MSTTPRILIVEDHEAYHKPYQMTLQDAFPCDIDFSTTGQGALDLLQSHHYDLVLLDLNLPDIPGREVLKVCRADHRDTHLPVIVLTGDTAPDVQTELLNLGADDFIEKGSAPEVLTARVSVQLRHKFIIDRATELAMEVDAFTAGVLHDIRNIENNVVSLCYLTKILVEEDAQKNRKEILENLDKLHLKASGLSAYASEIIDKVRQNQSQPKFGEVDINDIIDQVRRLLGRDGASDHELVIEGELVPAFADLHFLKMAILNIIQNSIKYAREGIKPYITVSQEVTDTEVVIAIRDNGVGIAESELHKVFDPFVRGSKTVGGKVGGLGLGLSMVSRAMAKIHGSVWAELPKDGKPGTVMKLRLPRPSEAQDQPA